MLSVIIELSKVGKSHCPSSQNKPHPESEAWRYWKYFLCALEISERIKLRTDSGFVTFSFPKMGNEQSQASKDESELAELAGRVMQESKNKGQVVLV